MALLSPTPDGVRANCTIRDDYLRGQRLTPDGNRDGSAGITASPLVFSPPDASPVSAAAQCHGPGGGRRRLAARDHPEPDCDPR